MSTGAVEPMSPGYEVDPNARPAGERYFSVTTTATGDSPKVEFHAYSSASASYLQRSVGGGALETVGHPQGRDEAMRFISYITRLDDGRLRAVVGYPAWNASPLTDVFYSNDDGATWHR